jgi:hypothetical protein
MMCGFKVMAMARRKPKLDFFSVPRESGGGPASEITDVLSLAVVVDVGHPLPGSGVKVNAIDPACVVALFGPVLGVVRKAGLPQIVDPVIRAIAVLMVNLFRPKAEMQSKGNPVRKQRTAKRHALQVSFWVRGNERGASSAVASDRARGRIISEMGGKFFKHTALYAIAEGK